MGKRKGKTKKIKMDISSPLKRMRIAPKRKRENEKKYRSLKKKKFTRTQCSKVVIIHTARGANKKCNKLSQKKSE